MSNSTGKPWRLLVVDDQEQMRSAVQRVFSFEGFEVIAAGTGSRALELLGTSSFHLVLLDVNMPDMDGFTVLARLREQLRLVDLPVIMVTGMVDETSVLKGKAHGVADYLVKPYKIADMLSRVSRVLSKSNAEIASDGTAA